MSIQVNDKLPNFVGVNQRGEKVDSQKYIGKKLVIFFYPKANTMGCTAEACNLSDNYAKFQAEGYEILGISGDSVSKQEKFHSKYQFPYDLIADESKEICELFGVWKLKKMMGMEYMGIVRTTFIFDENGICTEVIDKVKTKNHTEQILK